MTDFVVFLLTPMVACAAVFAVLAFLQGRKDRAEIAEALGRVRALEAAVDRQPTIVRDEVGREAQAAERRSGELRLELGQAVKNLADSLDQRLTLFTGTVEQRLKDLGDLDKANFDKLADSQSRRLGETNALVVDLTKLIGEQQAEGRKSAGEAMEKLRETLAGNLETLRKENEGKLEQMRATVEEKLQSTLEARLGESFKQVSERLEAVHKGLGDMQTLATGVGDLKRVLTDVRQRGAWGEVQLSGLLEDMLTPDQYERQARVREGSAERVDFAIKLPHDDGVLLPIDCKFPQEDYDRLLHAQSEADPLAVEQAAKALEQTIRRQARSIEEKYVHPPGTTNFALMYLPTEGLFAEVVRRPGLAAELQQKHRVTVTGPTTLAAVLNSLRMGFTTLAIQKRSSEVWQVLGEAKGEFEKYGQVWDKLAKQLETASKTVDEARSKTKTISRKLKSVQTLDLPAPQLVAIEGGLAADADETEVA